MRMGGAIDAAKRDCSAFFPVLMARARTLPVPVSDVERIHEVALALLAPLEPVELGVRLLGVTLSSLGEGEEELIVTAEQLALALE